MASSNGRIPSAPSPPHLTASEEEEDACLVQAARRILSIAVATTSPAPEDMNSIVSDLDKLCPGLPDGWSDDVLKNAQASAASNGERTSKSEISSSSSLALPAAAIGSFIIGKWNRFFHSKARPSACLLAGCIRIAFAIIFLADRLLMTMDFDFFFHPKHGVMPYVESKELTLLALAPHNRVFLWTMHIAGIVHGVLLLLGVAAPRLQAFGIFVILASFGNSTESMIYSGLDAIMITMALMLCFLPLQRRLSIYELWNWSKQQRPHQENKTDLNHVPMWPFRLLQIYLCSIFAGAALSKVTSSNWQDGSAMYYIIHHQGSFFGVTIFAPDWLYNRIGPLKLMTWASTVIECMCLITIWPKRTRVLTVIVMIAFHLGIDLSMNLHVFQWLMMVLWLSFLAEPWLEQQDMPLTPVVQAKASTRTTKMKHMLVNLLLIAFLVVLWIESFPTSYIVEMTPESISEWPKRARTLQRQLRRQVHPMLEMFAIAQPIWNLYDYPFKTQALVRANVTFLDGRDPAEWTGPIYDEMTFWQLKRHARVGDYWDHIAAGEGGALYCKAACRHLAKMHGPGVKRIKLIASWERTPNFKILKHLGPFDIAKQELIPEGEDKLCNWKQEDEEKEHMDGFNEKHMHVEF